MNEELYNVRCKDSDEIINDKPLTLEQANKFKDNCNNYDLHYHVSCTYEIEPMKAIF